MTNNPNDSTDNLADLFAVDPPDGTTLVAWTDGVPDVVWRDDNEAVLMGVPDEQCWWSNTKSAKPMTLAAALEGAERVKVAVPLEKAGTPTVDSGPPTDPDVTVERVERTWQHACDLVTLAELGGTTAQVAGSRAAELRAAISELRRAALLAFAHDRQPYPTADAYDRACAALVKHRERADRAEAERDEALAKLADRQQCDVTSVPVSGEGGC